MIMQMVKILDALKIALSHCVTAACNEPMCDFTECYFNTYCAWTVCDLQCTFIYALFKN